MSENSLSHAFESEGTVAGRQNSSTMQMNRVIVAGFVVKKPEVRYLPSGTAVANGRIAESSRYRDGNAEIKQHTNWHSLSFYGALADVALAL